MGKSVSGGSTDIATLESGRWGRFPSWWVQVTCLHFVFFHRWPISTVGRKELVGAKESQVLEIISWHGSTGKEFLEYISFLF